MVAERRRDHATEQASFRGHEARRAAGDAEQARHLVAEAREREALAAERRQAEESLAQITARREALGQLDRERVGLAPGAAALLAARKRFGDRVLGPLSDFVRTSRNTPSWPSVCWASGPRPYWCATSPRWTRFVPGTRKSSRARWSSLPAEPGPSLPANAPPLDERLRAEGPAAAWVRAALAGSQVLDEAGHVLRRASGAIFLGGAAAPSGPLRRRAELETLAQDMRSLRASRWARPRRASTARWRASQLEGALTESVANVERSREAERQATATAEDAARFVNNLSRELGAGDAEVARLSDRLAKAEQRMVDVDAALVEGDVARARLDEDLGAARAALAELESAQESVREKRAQWQVREAQVAARLQAATERLDRATSTVTDAGEGAKALTGELAPSWSRTSTCCPPGSPSGRKRGPSARWRCSSWRRRTSTPRTRCGKRTKR